MGEEKGVLVSGERQRQAAGEEGAGKEVEALCGAAQGGEGRTRAEAHRREQGFEELPFAIGQAAWVGS